MTDRVASSLNRDDPLNYVSFDDFAAGASSPYSTPALIEMWNHSHPENRVLAQGTTVAPSR